MHRRLVRQRIASVVVGLAVAAPVALAEDAPAGRTGMGASALNASQLWWNEPGLVEKLSLSAEQRQQMDATWAEFRRKLADHDAKTVRRDFTRALADGDWEAARRALALSVWPRTADLEVKIRVFELLSAEQREALIAARPAIGWPRWGLRIEPTQARRKGV